MNKHKTLIHRISTFSLSGLLLSMSTSAYAAKPIDYLTSLKTSLDSSGLDTSTSVLDTVLLIVKAFLGVVGLISLILIIYGGFLMMTSNGNEENIKKGRDIIFWAIIGVVIILSSLGIIQYIDTLF